MDLGFKVSSADLGGVLDGLTRPKGEKPPSLLSYSPET